MKSRTYEELHISTTIEMITATTLKMFHFAIDKDLSRQIFTLFGCVLRRILMFDGGNFLSEVDFGIVQSHRDSHVCLITVQLL